MNDQPHTPPHQPIPSSPLPQRQVPRALKRTLATGTALTALAGAFLLGTQVTQGGPTTAGGKGAPWGQPNGPGQTTPVAFHGALSSVSSCEDLTEHYVDLARDRVTEYGWQRPVLYDEVMPTASAEGGATSGRAPEVGSSSTGTTTQEIGVDESDVAKTDGSVLARIDDEAITLYDVTGSEPVEQGSLILPRFSAGELLLSGDTLVAIGTGQPSHRTGVGNTTRVLTLDISDPSDPQITHEATYDATLLSTRQHGSTVRFVFSAGLPDLDFVTTDSDTGSRTARERNQQAVEDSTIEDWLPTVQDDDGDETPLLNCADVAVPRGAAGLDTVAVVGFDVNDPTARSTVGVASEATTVYEADDRLFLAISGGWQSGEPWRRWDSGRTSVDTGDTLLLDFTLDGVQARYHGSVTVAGAIKDRWSLDWADDTLRVALGRSANTENHNAVVVYEEGADDLREVARVGDLGIDEDIKSVRWFDDLAIVVTFRETDPLYTVDLTDPRSPELLGALKIPGFSQYLHPVGQDQLIGMGQSVGTDTGRRGAQAALFDISDLRDPRQRDVVYWADGTNAVAGSDPRAFTWLPEADVAVTVIQDAWSSDSRTPAGELAVLRPDGATLRRERLDLPPAADLTGVRVLPVGEGAVLVAGDHVEMLDLS